MEKLDHHFDNIIQGGGSGLGLLLAKVKELAVYRDILTSLLDENLAAHCQVGNFKEGILVIISDSAAWASTLRYQTSQLLPALRKHNCFAGLKSIQIKVRPNQ